MTEESGSSPKENERELPTTPKLRFYPGQRILWHLRHKIPGPGKFKIRWAGPYLVEQVYDNGSVDVTTLQGESLGRVNMNKLKPYQEPETTQAYALQILACHILEAEIKNKRDHAPKTDSTTQSPNTSSKKNTTPTTGSTSYPDQATLDAEDLEVHQVMLEVYGTQPTPLEDNNPQHMGHGQTNSLKGHYTPIKPLGGLLRKTKPITEETPKKNANPTYPTPLSFRAVRTEHFPK